MQGLRKILRALAIASFLVASGGLFVDAALHGPGEYELFVAAALLIVAAGLALTWFWSPFG